MYTGTSPYSNNVACASDIFRPSGNHNIPPMDITRFGGSFHPSINCIPLIRCTNKSPATPVPYSFQHRHRANTFASNGRFGTVPCQVSQSSVCGDKSGGGGYSHAPVGSFRPSEPSTRFSFPIIPCASISFALAHITELTRCDPICTILSVFCAAATIATPSAAVCDIGFSQ